MTTLLKMLTLRRQTHIKCDKCNEEVNPKKKVVFWRKFPNFPDGDRESPTGFITLRAYECVITHTRP